MLYTCYCYFIDVNVSKDVYLFVIGWFSLFISLPLFILFLVSFFFVVIIVIYMRKIAWTKEYNVKKLHTITKYSFSVYKKPKRQIQKWRKKNTKHESMYYMVWRRCIYHLWYIFFVGFSVWYSVFSLNLQTDRRANEKKWSSKPSSYLYFYLLLFM